LAVGDKDGVVSVFDVNAQNHAEPKLVKSFEAHLCPIRCTISFILRFLNSFFTFIFMFSYPFATALAFTNDAATIVTGADDATVGVFDVFVIFLCDSKCLDISCIHSRKEGRKIALLTGHTGPVFAVAMSNGSKYLATGSFDKKVPLS